MNKYFKSILLFVALLFIMCLMSCSKENKTIDNKTLSVEQTQNVENTKETRTNEKMEQFLKNQVEVKMRELLDVSFGNRIEEVKIDSIKLFTGDNIPEDVKVLELNDNETAFEINFSVKAAKDVDESLFENMTGKYENGWVRNNINYGVLRPSGDNDYRITNYGSKL